MNAQCPECDSWIQVSRSAELWDTMICPICHTELQIIGESPPELDYADSDDDNDDVVDDFDFDDFDEDED